jgi:hypothetical protein
MSRSTGIETIRTISYKPDKMTFREYDKKMMAFHPELKYWKIVLTEEKPWEQMSTVDNSMLKYSTAEIEEIMRAERIAHSTYVMGNSDVADAYTNKDTAYEIREALRERFGVTGKMSLVELTGDFNKVPISKPYHCPDEWFEDLLYIRDQIEAAGGGKRTDEEVVANLLNTVPNGYDAVVTVIMALDPTDKLYLTKARTELRNYWIRNFKKKYETMGK